MMVDIGNELTNLSKISQASQKAFHEVENLQTLSPSRRLSSTICDIYYMTALHH